MIHEMRVFLSAIGSGLMSGFIYDLFRLKRRALKTGKRTLIAEDISFWLIMTILVFTTAFLANDGEVRFFFLLAVSLGIVSYFLLLSRWVIQIITFLVKVLLWPFIFMIKLLRKPVLWALGKMGAGIRRSEVKLKGAKIRIRRRFRSLGNIMRKI